MHASTMSHCRAFGQLVYTRSGSLQYRDQLMAVGQARERGIQVPGISGVVSAGKFEEHAGSKLHRPNQHTLTTRGKSLQVDSIFWTCSHACISRICAALHTTDIKLSTYCCCQCTCGHLQYDNQHVSAMSLLFCSQSWKTLLLMAMMLLPCLQLAACPCALRVSMQPL